MAAVLILDLLCVWCYLVTVYFVVFEGGDVLLFWVVCIGTWLMVCCLGFDWDLLCSFEYGYLCNSVAYLLFGFLHYYFAMYFSAVNSVLFL